MIHFRRCCVLAVLMFWLGGLTFYGTVVIPVGRATIGQPSQSIITRQVTFVFNISAALLLLPLAWDQFASSVRSRGRWLVWLGFGLVLPPLHWLYLQLTALMDGAQSSFGSFQAVHRCYLWLNGLQWLLAVVYFVLLVAAWRREDREVEKSVD